MEAAERIEVHHGSEGSVDCGREISDGREGMCREQAGVSSPDYGTVDGPSHPLEPL